MDCELSGERYKTTTTTGQQMLVFLMYLCGFFYFEWIVNSRLGLGVVLFAALFCGAAYWYMRVNGFGQTRCSLFYLGLTAISALNFALLDNGFLHVLNYLFLSLSGVYWICVTTNRRVDGALSGYAAADFINQLIVLPFNNFGAAFSALKQGHLMRRTREGEQQEMQRAKRAERGRNLLFGLLGLLVAMPILLLVIRLLSSADAAFQDMIGRLNFNWQLRLPEHWFEYGIELVAAVPVACYLFGMLHGDVSQKETQRVTKEKFDSASGAMRVLPRAMCYTAVGALILVYLAFFATQTGYLFSAFRDRLPVAMTYAAYARRGFFELCTVSGINLGVMWVAYLLMSRDKGKVPKGLRIETAALCTLTVMLIVTALSKMGLYIHYYGLTPLRFYTTCFMAILLVIFVMIGVRQAVDFHCAKWLILVTIIGFVSLTYCNADGLIASYNMDRYREGTLELDVNALVCLSDGVVKPAYQLYTQTTDANLKQQLQALILGFEGNEEQIGQRKPDYRSWNVQSWQAQQLREKILKN